MTDFVCAALAPLDLGTGIVRATLRAGGMPLIDVPVDADEARLEQLLARTPDGYLSFRMTPEQAGLLDRLAGRSHRLVLSGWRADSLDDCLRELARPEREIWLEPLGVDDIAAVDPALPFDGWLGRGCECGGRSGRQSAFILAQALARQEKPFWIQGGIGVHSASAARAAGACGVVLDDVLLLLRESGLPPRHRAILAELGSDDTAALGGEWGEPWRMAGRRDFAGYLKCKEDAARIARSAGDRAALWRDCAARRVGWTDGQAWPLGQLAGRAAEYAARYVTVGRLIGAVKTAADENLQAAARLQMLAPQSDLARAHGVRYPIVQGPMTRVSDTPSFAQSVADAGALPLLALAMMQGPQVAALLDEAAQSLKGKPWGVGLLGYLPSDLADAQVAEVVRAKPPFALIAGGRPDQARRLEQHGIATYIHVSSPEVLKLYLDQGARRFVFEGAECGGHIGPLNSFALWDAMIAVLSAWKGETLHVLFAGGIHDARSTAMVAAMAAPLADAAVRVGVLMGSAYLYTAEAVAGGAIVPAFQDMVRGCDRTVVIETGPGHRIRCAPSPFVDEFETLRGKLLQAGRPSKEMGETLEAEIVGRLRIASKAVKRDGDTLVAVDDARAAGLFMVGDVATLRPAAQSCAELHETVSAGATALIAQMASDAEGDMGAARPRGEAIAIVGIGCVLPGAGDAETLWRRLLDQVDVTEEVPAERWDWRLYYDADPAAPDRIVSKWGGFIKPLPFDHMRFGIPPNSLHSICVPQLLALEATRRALDDAGALAMDEAQRERTAVVFGVGSAGDLEQMLKTRTGLPLIDRPQDDALARLPEWTEESYPGILLNVVAGRVANRFDLHGANFTVDAACASSLAALDVAVRELQSGRSDVVLAGAVDAEMSPHAYTAFSKTRALSPTGRARPFDEKADGIVLSEGAVVLVLKRLSDAERDGDRIYATVRGIAGSSDGKGLGLTAPKPAGQMRALERAYAAAEAQMSELGLYEAHATGTKVGDRAELETLTTMLTRAHAPSGRCVVGSAKSLLGHTRSAAGMVGVVKAALALHHRVLPPHAGVEQPLAPLRDPASPIYLVPAPRPWLDDSRAARLAGVSAFGFGGTNFHAVLEEHADTGAAGAALWPVELFALAAAGRDGLLAEIARLENACGHVGARMAFRDLAYSSVAAARGTMRMAIVAGSIADLRMLLATARAKLEAGEAMPPGVVFQAEAVEGDLAFLFPGQGAQSCGMGAELALYHHEMRGALQQSGVADKILPRAGFTAEDKAAADLALTDTRVAQPAILAVSCGMLDMARRSGLRPARVAGHSLGEFTALHAAGVMSRADLFRLATARGALMADVGPDPGGMAVVALGHEELADYLRDRDGVWIANVNGPRQQVVAGQSEAIESLVKSLRADGHTAKRLMVGGAFHSPLIRTAAKPFADFLAGEIVMAPPALPVHANLDGAAYPAEPDAILRRCADHMEQQVDFVAQIEAMWDAGVRSFVELGPGRALTAMVAQILGDRPHLAVSADGGVQGWLSAIARLWVRGHAVNLEACFEDRQVRLFDLDRLPAPDVATEWFIDGGRVSRAGEDGMVGVEPFLTADSPASGIALGPANGTIAAYTEYQETMRRFLEQQERVLARMLGEDAPVTAEPPPRPVEIAPAPKVAALAPPAANETSLDPATLTAAILRLVAERTGYPLDVLGAEQDLEADLGVDSIKRIEIIGRLISEQPATVAERLQEAFDRLVEAKSASGLAQAVMRASLTRVEAPAPSITASNDGCPRFVMRPVAKPLPSIERRGLEGLHLVSACAGDLPAALAARLQGHGATVRVVTLDGDLAARVAALREALGPVRGIVHLAPLGVHADHRSPDAGKATGDAAVKGFFRLLQCCMDEIRDALDPLHILSISQMGGASPDVPQEPPAGAGAHGLLRSIAREFPHILAKSIDFDAGASVEGMIDAIVDETLIPGGGEEIGYANGDRFIFNPEAAPLNLAAASGDWRPQPGWIVLATGGARGITAEICRELAHPGVRLILVGRSARAAGDLDAYRQTGAEVEYHAVDVRSEEAFGALIDDIYARHGRIDAVLHGAGIIEDRRLDAKTLESFERVFDTKVGGALALSRHLKPEQLKWMVLFGSVSGRFGNSGQVDYGAANEALTRLGRWMNAQWQAPRVLTIEWGPWRGAGMAAEGVQHLLGSRGVKPIDIESGRRFFADELAHGAKADADVIAGQGPWGAEPDQLLGSLFDYFLLLRGERGVEEAAGEAQ